MRELLEARFESLYPYAEERLKNVGPEAEETLRQRSDWVKLCLDPLTQLLSRATGFDLLREEVRSIFGVVPDSFDAKVLLRTDESSLALVLGDIAYLSLANDGGRHDVGDDFIEKIGRATLSVANKNFLLWRNGGDEFGGVIAHQPFEEVITRVEWWGEAISRIEVDFLKAKGLSPRIDIGVATLQETCRFLYDNFPLNNRGLERTVLSTLVRLADFRSAYIKCIGRLELLALLLLADESLYDELIGFLAKGANNPSKKKIRTLSQLLEQDKKEEFVRSIRNLVLIGWDSSPEKKFALAPYVESLERE